MTQINLDYESYSEVDIKTEGLDRYSAHPSTEILMAAYSIDGGKVQHEELMRGRKPSAELRDALTDPHVKKWAFNAQFERVMTRRVMKIKTPYTSWRCTMVRAYMMGFAGDLLKVGTQIGLKAEHLKDTEGKKLIQIFCKPQRITKANPFLRRNEMTDPELWEKFCRYNVKDVIAEMAIMNRLASFHCLESEWDLYALDQYINDTGVYIDDRLAASALELAEECKPILVSRMQQLTGLDNPNSTAQIKPWLLERGYPFDDMRKDSVTKALREQETNGMEDSAAEVLRLRLGSNKSSLAKYKTMLSGMGYDNRFRFSLQFAGAQRTNRWAGRRLQTQNVSRTPKFLEDVGVLSIANELIRKKDLDGIELLGGNPMDVLAGCIRSALCAAPGHKFVVADLSSIESVGIGWLTDCRWFLDTLSAGHDLYRSFAAEWLKLPYEETKPHRPKAKPATLGAGYRLGGGHMADDGKKTGLWGYAENMGVHMTQQEAQASVDAFRELCPEIVNAWYDLEKCVFRCLRTRKAVKWRLLTIRYEKPFLTIELPSGRRMFYFRPRIVNRVMTVTSGPRKGETYSKENFQYEGMADNKKWGPIFSHGGKLIENIVQALCRDILAVGLRRAKAAGFRIVMHIHDEIVTEVPIDSPLTPDDLVKAMAAPISWAPGVPLGAAAWEGLFYRKD